VSFQVGLPSKKFFWYLPGCRNLATDGPWVVNISQCISEDWLHVVQCLIGNDLIDTTQPHPDKSEPGMRAVGSSMTKEFNGG